MDVKEMVMNAGILGAGGAGFPTHVKINCQAGAVIVNGAECEPLLRVDQQVMELYAAEVVEGLRLVMEQTGAKEGVIALKKHLSLIHISRADPCGWFPLSHEGVLTDRLL